MIAVAIDLLAEPVVRRPVPPAALGRHVPGPRCAAGWSGSSAWAGPRPRRGGARRRLPRRPARRPAGRRAGRRARGRVRGGLRGLPRRDRRAARRRSRPASPSARCASGRCSARLALAQGFYGGGLIAAGAAVRPRPRRPARICRCSTSASSASSTAAATTVAFPVWGWVSRPPRRAARRCASAACSGSSRWWPTRWRPRSRSCGWRRSGRRRAAPRSTSASRGGQRPDDARVAGRGDGRLERAHRRPRDRRGVRDERAGPARRRRRHGRAAAVRRVVADRCRAVRPDAAGRIRRDARLGSRPGRGSPSGHAAATSARPGHAVRSCRRHAATATSPMRGRRGRRMATTLGRHTRTGLQVLGFAGLVVCAVLALGDPRRARLDVGTGRHGLHDGRRHDRRGPGHLDDAKARLQVGGAAEAAITELGAAPAASLVPAAIAAQAVDLGRQLRRGPRSQREARAQARSAIRLATVASGVAARFRDPAGGLAGRGGHR